MRILLGAGLAAIGLWALIWYHGALWSSGGPDINRNIVQYYIPYTLAVATALSGLAIGWIGFKAMRR